MPIQTGVKAMYSSKIISGLILLSLMVSLPAIAAEDSATPQIAEKPADAQYPFIATVAGNNVYIRSGKGTAYYQCGKVNMDDQLTVIGEAFGWAEILPPAGSFSWIHKNYVDVKADQPTIGVLNGDNVRVWAGSDGIASMYSSSMQTKLNTGEIVELFADQPAESDHYKIKPPAGAKLAINCAFLKYLKPAAPNKAVVIPPRGDDDTPTDMPASNETEAPTFKNLEKDAEPSAPAKADTAESGEPKTESDIVAELKAGDSEALKACYALAEKIDAELEKPLTKQNYNAIKKEIQKVKTDADDKAAAYVQILAERIARYELAVSIIDTLKQQDASLAKAKEKIEKAHQAEIKKVHKEADYIYTGILKVSHVYTSKTGHKRYLLQGPGGKILCYAVPASEQAAGQFEALVGKRVGIQGEVTNDTKSLVTLIKATAVKPI
ncbi:MAG: SH3 domain-containing protein [Planctomycetota bacterium]|jgi:SH3-like domain-containing protein